MANSHIPYLPSFISWLVLKNTQSGFLLQSEVCVCFLSSIEVRRTYSQIVSDNKRCLLPCKRNAKLEAVGILPPDPAVLPIFFLFLYFSTSVGYRRFHFFADNVRDATIGIKDNCTWLSSGTNGPRNVGNALPFITSTAVARRWGRKLLSRILWQETENGRDDGSHSVCQLVWY